MRSVAREAVFKYLFAKKFNDEINAKFLDSLAINENLSEDDKVFATNLAKNIESHYDEIVKVIEDTAEGYSYNRIFAADKCALIIGVSEILYSDVADAVCADEAVKLAKKYSSDKSTSFVNGILSKIISGKNQ